MLLLLTQQSIYLVILILVLVTIVQLKKRNIKDFFLHNKNALMIWVLITILYSWLYISNINDGWLNVVKFVSVLAFWATYLALFVSAWKGRAGVK